MMIGALEEALAQDPGFPTRADRRRHDERRDDVSARNIIARSSERRSERRPPALIANYPPQKPIIDAQEASALPLPAR